MADSNITKMALATALKELMAEMPFEKINISHICERRGMSRKSFYYHFRDKYDLFNWIFDTEVIAMARERLDGPSLPDPWSIFSLFCQYFYENRAFYRCVLQISGQDSFSEHFEQCIFPIFRRIFSFVPEEDESGDFVAIFLTDALISSIRRWITDKHCIPPDEFVERVKRLGELLRYAERQPLPPPPPPPALEPPK